MTKEGGREIGFVGLGRMGLNMATNLIEKGYRVVGLDPSADAQKQAADAHIEVVPTYASMIASLSAPRVMWLMIPSKFVDDALADIIPLLEKGDTVIDGGNSFYKDTLRRYASLKESDIHFLDCGTSGGMDGARHGAAIMVGGSKDVFVMHEHIFKALAANDGYALVGKEGAGHFVKMVHNGIEYGMMGAIAEGVAILHDHEIEFGINLADVFKPYEHESIVTSKLVTWLRQAYDSGQIDTIAGIVPAGETEEEMEHVTTLGDAQVLKAALAQRKQTRERESYLGKLIAAMRNQFGGHTVIQK